tara:strand:+ start:864 stop:2156 length:1293 start_codon:yes stop_codon:yes gene_type:complete
MKKIVDRFTPKSVIARSVLVLVGGTAMAQAITAASMPFVTRLYTPELIGIISIYLAFFNFWSAILSWRYESALLIASDEDVLHHVFRLGAILTIMMALLALLALGFLQHTDLLGFGVLPTWSPIIACLSLLGYGWFMLYRSWLLRLRKVQLISVAAVARSGANACVRLVAGMAGFGILGLFIAEVLGSWAALSSLRKQTHNLVKDNAPSWSLNDLLKAGARYKKYAQFEMPSVMVNQLAIALPVPIVGALYGAKAAGLFGLARLLYAIPNGQIGKAAGDVFQMELSKLVRDGGVNRAKKLFVQFSLRLAVIGVVPLILAIVAAPTLVPYVFGKEWEAMGLIVAQMAPWMYMALIVSSMSRALSVLEKQQWKLIYDVFALLVVYVCYFIAKVNQINLLGFVQYLAWGMVVSYVIYYIIIYVSVTRFNVKQV